MIFEKLTMISLFSIPLISKNKFGFRLSLIDVLMILFTILLVCLYPPDLNNPTSKENLFHYLIPYIVLSFFLFCNVFRVKTKYELCWLTSATINIIFYLTMYENMILFFITQSLCTMIAIIFEIKSDNYHGVFCKNKA